MASIGRKPAICGVARLVGGAISVLPALGTHMFPGCFGGWRGACRMLSPGVWFPGAAVTGDRVQQQHAVFERCEARTLLVLERVALPARQRQPSGGVTTTHCISFYL